MNLLLIKPTLDALLSYSEALERGWFPDTTSDAAIGRNLTAIAQDRELFIETMDDLQALGGAVTLPDGSEVPRLPGFTRWLWDGEFAGSFSFRFSPGTESLPAHCLGHIGYAVPAWKRGWGYATRGLAMLLEEVRGHPLTYVTITTDQENEISQKVIAANGGHLVERFIAEPAYGSGEKLRWRIDL